MYITLLTCPLSYILKMSATWTLVTFCVLRENIATWTEMEIKYESIDTIVNRFTYDAFFHFLSGKGKHWEPNNW